VFGIVAEIEEDVAENVVIMVGQSKEDIEPVNIPVDALYVTLQDVLR